jgi:hypothetical protein
MVIFHSYVTVYQRVNHFYWHKCELMRFSTQHWLVVWNMEILFFHILGIIILTDFHMFQRGWNTNQIRWDSRSEFLRLGDLLCQYCDWDSIFDDLLKFIILHNQMFENVSLSGIIQLNWSNYSIGILQKWSVVSLRPLNKSSLSNTGKQCQKLDWLMINRDLYYLFPGPCTVYVETS